MTAGKTFVASNKLRAYALETNRLTEQEAKRQNDYIGFARHWPLQAERALPQEYIKTKKARAILDLREIIQVQMLQKELKEQGISVDEHLSRINKTLEKDAGKGARKLEKRKDQK